MFKHTSFDRFKRSMPAISFITAFSLVLSLVVPRSAMAQVAELDILGDKVLPQVCVAENLVTNGSFENPNVGSWDIFAGDGVAVPSWTSEWMSGSGDSFAPSIEIHGGVNGWDAQDGSQYVELDGDTEGPTGQTNGEAASTKISQVLSTVPGASYNVSFWTSARPGVEDNEVEFSWNGSVVDNIEQDGSSLSDTSWELWSGVLTADDVETVISFADKSSADSLGSFVDNVVVTPICGSITVHKFLDENGDGVANEGEEALSGWTFYLDQNDNDSYDDGEPTAETDEFGVAYFDDLYSGDYTVREVWQDGWVQTYPTAEDNYEYNVTVGVQSIINLWFGNQEGVMIRAHKVVCDDESYLPNWGAGADDIDENTAMDFVADSDEHCWMQEGWDFQWGPQDSYDPGDTLVGEAGEPWVTFGPTDATGLATALLTADQVEGNSHLWFREVLQDGYIPFTHDQNGNTNTNDVSAEVYCHADVLNYDNYDRIDGVEVGGVYDCVAFNVAEPEEDNCDQIDEDDNGWYGRYYNYVATHPDMNLDPSLWPDKTHGDPQSYINSWDTDWYDAQYLVDTDVDADLNFGAFFPLDYMGNDTGNHNYHFGVHWTAKVTSPADGNYNYNLTSDDDVWVYMDGILVSVGGADASGIHAPTAFPGTMFMTAGDHIVDIYFAERHVVDSWMSFAFENEDLKIHPWNEDCENTISISGMKFNDLDGDGEQEEGDNGLAGWTIYVDLDQDGSWDENEPYDVTNVDGMYLIEGLEGDSVYYVRELAQENWIQTYPVDPNYWPLEVGGDDVTGKNFGNHYTGNGGNDTCEQTISGTVFHDLDANTNIDATDLGLENWIVYLDLDNDNVWDEATEPFDESGTEGYFEINGVLAPGTYTVREVVQGGWDVIYPSDGDENEYLVTLDCFATKVEIEDVLVQAFDLMVQAVETGNVDNSGVSDLRFANVLTEDSSDDNGGGGSSSGSRRDGGSNDGSSGDNGEVLGEQVAADTLPVTGLGGVYLIIMIVMGFGLSFILPKKELE